MVVILGPQRGGGEVRGQSWAGSRFWSGGQVRRNVGGLVEVGVGVVYKRTTGVSPV